MLRDCIENHKIMNKKGRPLGNLLALLQVIFAKLDLLSSTSEKSLLMRTKCTYDSSSCSVNQETYLLSVVINTMRWFSM